MRRLQRPRAGGGAGAGRAGLLAVWRVAKASSSPPPPSLPYRVDVACCAGRVVLLMGDERPGGAWDSSKSFPARSSPPVVSGNEEGQAGKLGECTAPNDGGRGCRCKPELRTGTDTTAALADSCNGDIWGRVCHHQSPPRGKRQERRPSVASSPSTFEPLLRDRLPQRGRQPRPTPRSRVLLVPTTGGRRALFFPVRRAHGKSPRPPYGVWARDAERSLLAGVDWGSTLRRRLLKSEQ